MYLYGGKELLSVSQVVIHQDYVQSVLGSDVALLKLEKPLDCSANTKSVKLFSGSLEVNSRCWVTGWGTVRMHGMYQEKIRAVGANLSSEDPCWVTLRF